jgi:Mn-containing catalase
MYVDFQGEISLDHVRKLLREDQSREAKQLVQKLIEDKGVDDLLIALADILKEHLQTGINEEIVKENLVTYSQA